MNFKLRRRYVAISASVAVTFALVLATPAAAAKTQLTSRTSNGETKQKTIDIVGGNILAINQFVETTYHFKQGTVHVRQGDRVVLTNATDDVHTFSLVDGSRLPTTLNDVFGCGAPGTICNPILAAHLPQGFPPGPPTGPPPACPPTTVPTAFCIPYIDGGSPSLTPPGLDTVFTLTAKGDSVAIFPVGCQSQ